LPLRVSITRVCDDSIESLLESWARFVRGGWRPQCCGSAEGRFKPQRVSDDEARKPLPRLWSPAELWQCERAIAALPVPLGKFVRYVWVRNMPPVAAIRIAKLTPGGPRSWPQHRAAAFQQIRERMRGTINSAAAMQ